MNRPYISNELFHLVGRSHPTDHEANYQTLLKVINSSCVSHPPHNPHVYEHRIAYNWESSLFSEELIVPSITCFCDIPFETLGIHMKKYGMFGLSFSREFLIKRGARPVIYMPMQPSDTQRGWGTIHCESLLHAIEQKWKGFYELVVSPVAQDTRTSSFGQKPTSTEDAIRDMDDVFTQHFLAFIKPFNSELPDEHPDNFYLEREWRKFGNLGFQPREVMRVIVSRDYVERLKKEHPTYSEVIVAALE